MDMKEALLADRFKSMLKNPNIEQNSLLTRGIYGGLGLIDAYNQWEPQASDIYNIPKSMAEALYSGFKQDVSNASNVAGLYDDKALSQSAEGGLNLAMSAALGGAPMPVEQGALRMFGGLKAKTVNPEALSLAKRMEAEGASRDEIWKATGEQYGQPWFNDKQGGGWKFEIDDSKMSERDLFKSDPYAKELLDEYDEISTEFGKGFTHGQLRRAYPYEFNEGEMLTRPYTSEGSYSMGTYEVPLKYRYGDKVAKADKSIASHEFQHGIQELEDFAIGGMSDEFVAEMAKDKARIIDDAVKEFRSGNITADEFYQIQDMTPQELSHMKYKRLAGEAESRNVQTRQNMTMQERINKAPWETLDVPEDELIYRFK